MLPEWGGCPKKFEYRRVNIIEPAKKIFGPSLPKQKQYWTMSGKCANNDILVPGCEFDQTLQSGLIESDQFFGVEINQETHNHNKNLPGNWINSDFLRAMKNTHSLDKFNPAIIHADLVCMPKAGAQTLANIIVFLSEINISPLLVVGNFILRTARIRGKKSGDTLIDELSRYKSFTNVLNKWNWSEELYEYDGTGNRSTTTMGSIQFLIK
jgi:hypothetical protein